MPKVLIIDDSRDLLEAMELILVHKGYHVKTLNNITNILQEIATYQPDLVIVDVFIGGEDGREICKQLKTRCPGKTLCVIVFSASAKALENFSNYDADDVLEKPFGINNLVEKIENLLASKQTVTFPDALLLKN